VAITRSAMASASPTRSALSVAANLFYRSMDRAVFSFLASGSIVLALAMAASSLELVFASLRWNAEPARERSRTDGSRTGAPFKSNRGKMLSKAGVAA
jgi:hypothetical protein